MVKLIKKDVPYVWVEECQTSFQALKEALVGSKVMAYPKDQGTYILDIGASDSAIGAVLNQEQDGREKLIAFGSRTLNKAEANYCVTDKELSIRYFGEYYRQYLLGKRLIVRTDHQALVWLLDRSADQQYFLILIPPLYLTRVVVYIFTGLNLLFMDEIRVAYC